MEALGDHNMERAWYDGVALLEEEVDEMLYQANAPREDSRAARKAARPGGMFGG